MTAVVRVVGVAVLRGSRVLAARRHQADGAGGWEFPGGKVDPGESDEQAAVREIAEELGMVVRVTGWLDGAVEIRPSWELRVALAEMVAGEPVPAHGQHDAVRWFPVAELDGIDWLPADVPFAHRLAVSAPRPGD